MRKRYSKSDVSDRILHAARELFITKGYMSTSIRDIATAAGSNVAHIKYYFESKANLFEIIFDEAFDIFIKHVHSTFSSDLPFLEMVEEWINIYFKILPEYPQIPMFMLSELTRSPETLVKKIVEKNPQRIFDKLSQRMDKEIEAGRIKDIPVVDFGMNVLALSVFPFY